MNATLGYHRSMSALFFGEDSPATKYLDDKIATQGSDAEVLVDERQLIALLMELHKGGQQPR